MKTEEKKGRVITCNYLNICTRAKHSCLDCKNNKTRNQKVDMFVQHNDDPIPLNCPKLTFSGPAEQTDGYECPVCHGFTNPYALNKDHECGHCGYKLNV